MTRSKRRKLARQHAEYRRLLAMPPDRQSRALAARISDQPYARCRKSLGPYAEHLRVRA